MNEDDAVYVADGDEVYDENENYNSSKPSNNECAAYKEGPSAGTDNPPTTL